MARRAAVAMALALGTACGSLIGFEDGYTTAPPDAGSGGEQGQAGEGGAGGLGGGGGEGGTAACAHPICEAAIATLDPACDPCVEMVCQNKPFCCDSGWEPDCVVAAQDLCTVDCCGDGQCLGETCASCPEDCGTCACGHGVCYAGTPLDANTCFTPCGQAVCDALPECCGEYGWTIECTEKSIELCPADTCITSVCAENPSCCAMDGAWTASCVATVTQQCGTACDCGHNPCGIGEALAATCDPCVASVCDVDSFCCTTGWDSLCASYMQTVCGAKC